MTTSLDLVPATAGSTSTKPTGPAASSSAPDAATAAATVRTAARLAPLYLAHDALRADFARLARTVADAGTDQADRDLDARLADVTARFRRHHLGEDDLLWPALCGRVARADTDLGALAGQRARVEQLLTQAADVTRPSAQRAGLVTELVRQVGSYLDAKERIVFPLLAQHLGTLPAAGQPGSTAAAAGPVVEARLRSVGYGWFASRADAHAPVRRAAGRGAARSAAGAGRFATRLRHRHS